MIVFPINFFCKIGGDKEEKFHSYHLESRNRASVKKSQLYAMYTERYLSHIDDRYNKLKRNIGNDFSKTKEGGATELYSFQCGNCGYRNIHNIKVLLCGCGKELQGRLVYRKIGDTVIYDIREKRKGRR